jgi:hypothetical protein
MKWEVVVKGNEWNVLTNILLQYIFNYNNYLVHNINFINISAC